MGSSKLRFFTAVILTELISADPGAEYPEVLRVSYGSCQNVRRDQNRLRAEWPRPVKEIDRREGSAERSRDRTEANPGIATLQRGLTPLWFLMHSG